jgi:hypothetical protein
VEPRNALLFVAPQVGAPLAFWQHVVAGDLATGVSRWTDSGSQSFVQELVSAQVCSRRGQSADIPRGIVHRLPAVATKP